ncbi:hypothetical protein F4818DRAFT_438212 [Hypoxylon cercidicola]|nr:hypothetical protein F4818DRAFT_438212 [Hypoxylon cercidicola]
MPEQAPDLLDALVPSPTGDCVDVEQPWQAFDLLFMTPQALDRYRVFLLIDGLDELDGKSVESHHDAVHILQTWTSQSEGKVKICVSKDTEAYVTEYLKIYPRFRKLEDSCEEAAVTLDSDCYLDHFSRIRRGAALVERLKSMSTEQNAISAFLTALIERGSIGVDLLDTKQKAHVSKCGCHTTEPWVDFVELLLTSESPGDSNWALTELCLDQGANPRICLVSSYVPSLINECVLENILIREFIAPSEAPNRERLSELANRNADVIETEEAVGTAVQ